MSDSELMKKAQSGDRNAFRTVVEGWQGFVYSIAYRYTGNMQDAEDLVQESFVRVFKNLDRFDPEQAIKPWLGRIVTNICLDYIKSSGAKQMKNMREIDEAMHKVDIQSPSTALENVELQGVIRTLAAQLTPRQQSVFILRDLEGWGVDEVIQALEISSDTLKSNLYHARKKVKEGLQAYYGDRLLKVG